MLKNLPTSVGDMGQSLGCKDPPEQGMATHSSILAWETLWRVEPDGLQSMGSQIIGHDLMTKEQQNGKNCKNTGSNDMGRPSIKLCFIRVSDDVKSVF